MIGVSLPYEWLAGGEGLLGDVNTVLENLKARGVDSIELRTVFLRHDPLEVLRVAEMLWKSGFQISVHAKAHSKEQAIEEVFSPISEVLKNLRQEKLTVVIHPIKGDNAAMLCALADYRDANGYPVTIALENNRLLPDKSEGDCAALVLNAVMAANRKDVGICFDMGHYGYYWKKNREGEDYQLPPKDFISHVVHTHIHALKGFKTHFPLGLFELPLQEIFEKLSYKYFGVYNLELDFPRFKDEIADLPVALYDSVAYLEHSLPRCARVYRDLRRNFDKDFSTALSIFEKDQGNYCSLVGASSYLFNTNGYRWGMDLSFRHAYLLAKTPHKLGELLKDLKLILVTHAHADHFEEATVRQLAKNDTKWIIPDFMEEKAQACGISPKKMLLVSAGDALTVGPLTVRVFEGRHFRPDTGKGTRAYGYYVTAENAPSLAFPSDVRDYSIEGLPELPKADVCFAHVWMGDQSDKVDFGAYPAQIARYMLNFSKKNLIFSHLYENGRKDSQMWTKEHARLLEQAVKENCPKIKTVIPKIGEILKLR